MTSPRPYPLRSVTQAYAAICFISLFACVTNLIPVSVGAFALTIVMLPLFGFEALRLSSIARWNAAFLAYIVGSTLLYWPASFLDPMFYRYDGNVLISFAPLFLVGVFSLRANPDRVLMWFLIFATIMSSGAIAFDLLRGTFPPHSLFVAPNAFGGFMMFTFVAAFTLMTQHRSFFTLTLFLLQSGILMLTYSRGSWIGAVGALIAYFCLRTHRRWPLYGSVGGIVALEAALLSWSYPIYVQQRASIRDYVAQAATGVSAKAGTAYIRLFENWPRGLYAFFHSPLFGAGFGSVNDLPLTFNKDGLIQFNQSPNHLFNDGHAHNTYIHWLGEIGIVGLALFLGLWVVIHRLLKNSEDFSLTRDTLYMSFWSLTFSSFTEHRIPSPSNVFPFVLMFVLYAACVRSSQQQRAQTCCPPS